MGDPACWLDRVCAGCGEVADDPDELDGRRRCPDCAAASPDGDDVEG
jgi:hypothetical protein